MDKRLSFIHSFFCVKQTKKYKTQLKSRIFYSKRLRKINNKRKNKNDRISL